MTITVFAPANSIWVYEYVRNVVIPFGFERCCIVSEESGRYSSFFESNGIMTYTVCRDGRIDEGKIREVVAKIGHSDILHVHYALCSSRVFKALAAISDRVVVSYWGSDLYDCGVLRRVINLPMLFRADCIHLINENMRRNLNRMYCSLFTCKIKVFDFGCSAYDYIDSVIAGSTVEECKEHFGLSSGKMVVSLGYNSLQEQQHEELIKQLDCLDVAIKARLTVVIPWGYGDDDKEYFGQIETLLQNAGIDHLILKRFLEYDEIAILRRASDIFLYGRRTDAQSASFLEYLYAGSIVIKPIWLKYDELESLGIRYQAYSEFEEIPDMIIKIMNSDITKQREELAINRDILRDFNSWAAVYPDWRGLYE